MSLKTPKPAASQPEVAAVVPPVPASVPVIAFPSEAAPTPPDRPRAEPVLLRRRTDAPDLTGGFRQALERIASGRLCACRGDHDPQLYDCPRSIARTALEAAP